MGFVVNEWVMVQLRPIYPVGNGLVQAESPPCKVPDFWFILCMHTYLLSSTISTWKLSCGLTCHLKIIWIMGQPWKGITYQLVTQSITVMHRVPHCWLVPQWSIVSNGTAVCRPTIPLWLKMKSWIRWPTNFRYTVEVVSQVLDVAGGLQSDSNTSISFVSHNHHYHHLQCHASL